MIKKTYRSATKLKINIDINGHTIPILFQPYVRAGSYFITENEELQKAIEQHSLFNQYFYLFNEEQTTDDNPSQDNTSANTEAPNETTGFYVQEPHTRSTRALPDTETLQADPPTTEPTVVEVIGIPAAVDYLKQNFDIPKTQLRSKTAVLEAAKQHNIIFKGIE